MYTNIICNHGYHVIYFHIQLVQKNLVILEEIFAALDKIPQYFFCNNRILMFVLLVMLI